VTVADRIAEFRYLESEDRDLAMAVLQARLFKLFGVVEAVRQIRYLAGIGKPEGERCDT
jgi:capsule polysaccharide export protein KpsE/RkpR